MLQAGAHDGLPGQAKTSSYSRGAQMTSPDLLHSVLKRIQECALTLTIRSRSSGAGTTVWRPLLSVRVMARTSLAITFSPSASSKFSEGEQPAIGPSSHGIPA